VNHEVLCLKRVQVVFPPQLTKQPVLYRHQVWDDSNLSHFCVVSCKPWAISGVNLYELPLLLSPAWSLARKFRLNACRFAGRTCVWRGK